MKQYLQRVLLICVGFFIIGTGGSIFVYSDLGADSLNLLSQGIAGIFHLQVGTVNSLLQLLFFLILLLIARRRIGLGTVIGIFLIGFVMNLWAPLLSPWLEQAPLAVRCLCVVVAPVLVGIGVAMVQTADLGMVPNDLLPLIIYEKLSRFEYRYVRIAYDLLQFVIGLLLGGVFGIGTVISALLTGPSIQWGLSLIARFQKGTCKI